MTSPRLRVSCQYIAYAHGRWGNNTSRQLVTHASFLVPKRGARRHRPRKIAYLPLADVAIMNELRRVAREILATVEVTWAIDPRWPHARWVRRAARRILFRLERRWVDSERPDRRRATC